MVRLTGENLWDERDALIAFGIHIAQVLASDLAMLHAHEGRVIGIHAAKHSMLRHAPHIIGYTLQRRRKHWNLVIVHISYCLMAVYRPLVIFFIESR